MLSLRRQLEVLMDEEAQPPGHVHAMLAANQQDRVGVLL